MSEPQDSIIVPTHGTYHLPPNGSEWYRWEDGGKVSFTVDQIMYTVEAQPATWHHLTAVDGHPYFDGKLVRRAPMPEKAKVEELRTKLAESANYGGNCIECGRGTHCTYEVCDNCMTDLKKLRAEVERLSEGWISVDDRIPESKDDGALVYFSKTGSIETVHIQDYFDDMTSGVVDGVQTHSKWYKSQKVTHWMPLPEAPQAEGEKECT